MQDRGVVRVVVVARMGHAAVDPGRVMRRDTCRRTRTCRPAARRPIPGRGPTTSAIALADEPASAQDSVSRMLVLTALTTAGSSRAASIVAANRARSITRSGVDADRWHWSRLMSCFLPRGRRIHQPIALVSIWVTAGQAAPLGVKGPGAGLTRPVRGPAAAPPRRAPVAGCRAGTSRPSRCSAMSGSASRGMPTSRSRRGDAELRRRSSRPPSRPPAAAARRRRAAGPAPPRPSPVRRSPASALKRSTCGSTIALAMPFSMCVARADGVAEHRRDAGAGVVGALAAQHRREHQLAAHGRVVVPAPRRAGAGRADARRASAAHRRSDCPMRDISPSMAIANVLRLGA